MDSLGVQGSDSLALITKAAEDNGATTEAEASWKVMKLRTPYRSLGSLQQEVIACRQCPRLIRFCREVARQKRRMYRDEEYWGRPLPSFGDPKAELLILGLAPAAHGGNRTGRMFTGDRSGDFLYRTLYEAGFASQPESLRQGDGLKLNGCYITASLRCAPPGNKPAPEELRRCRPYLVEELALLTRVRAVLALGRIAFDTFLRIAYDELESPRLLAAPPGRPRAASSEAARAFQLPPRSSFRFAHGISYALAAGLPRLFASYHPSQQNTQTGKLTAAMFRQVLEDIRKYLEA